ncbi:MAG TPA: isochorismatase family cysteine hydrolase [Gammaproteobacteria bacterium]|nr:isochorismatase family cysteine hydrolase [Gammaproteobacteria bacterium]
MKKTALIVIDFINDIVDLKGKFTATAEFVDKHKVIDQANQVIRFAREQQIPIVLVKVGFSAGYLECPAHSPVFGRAKELQVLQLNTWGTEFHEKLAYQPTDLVIVKPRVNAFYSTALEAFLRANAIQNVIITGVSTDMAVQTTAREAHDRDYKVFIPGDACGAGSLEAHEATLKTLQRVATVIAANELTVELLK